MYGVRKFTLVFSGFALVALATCSQTVACKRRHYNNCCPAVVCCVDDAATQQPNPPPGDFKPFTDDDIKLLKDNGATDDQIQQWTSDKYGHNDVDDIVKKLKTSAFKPFTDEDKKMLKDAGATDDQITKWAEDKYGHDDVGDILKKLKASAFKPFTDEDKKKLKDAGATDPQIKKWADDKYGHDDVEDIIKKLKQGDEASLRAKIIIFTLRPPLSRLAAAMVTLPPKTPAAPATITVKLPAGASLMIDEMTTQQTGSERIFLSPPLTPGRTFHYTLTAERIVDGVKEELREEIEVAAGRETKTTLDFTSTAVVRK